MTTAAKPLPVIEGVLSGSQLMARRWIVRRIIGLLHECDHEGFLLDDLFDEARDEFLKEIGEAS